MLFLYVNYINNVTYRGIQIIGKRFGTKEFNFQNVIVARYVIIIFILFVCKTDNNRDEILRRVDMRMTKTRSNYSKI